VEGEQKEFLARVFCGATSRPYPQLFPQTVKLASGGPNVVLFVVFLSIYNRLKL